MFVMSEPFVCVEGPCPASVCRKLCCREVTVDCDSNNTIATTAFCCQAEYPIRSIRKVRPTIPLRGCPRFGLQPGSWGFFMDSHRARKILPTVPDRWPPIPDRFLPLTARSTQPCQTGGSSPDTRALAPHASAATPYPRWVSAFPARSASARCAIPLWCPCTSQVLKAGG